MRIRSLSLTSSSPASGPATTLIRQRRTLSVPPSTRRIRVALASSSPESARSSQAGLVLISSWSGPPAGGLRSSLMVPVENTRGPPRIAVSINPTRRGAACYRARPSMAELRQRNRKRARPLEGAPRTVMARSQRKLIAILSRNASLYSTRRLVEAASERGHRAIVVDTMRCIMVLIPEAPKMIYRGVELRGIDVAIPRIGASITGYGMQVVNHLDMTGVPVLASSAAISRSRDKLRCLQLLSRSGLDIPRTVMAHDRSNVPRLVDEVGGLPAIIKLLRGTQGVGVMLASTMAEV